MNAPKPPATVPVPVLSDIEREAAYPDGNRNRLKEMALHTDALVSNMAKVAGIPQFKKPRRR